MRTLIKDIVSFYKFQRDGEFVLPEDLNGKEFYNFAGIKNGFVIELNLEFDEDVETVEVDGAYYREEDVIEIRDKSKSLAIVMEAIKSAERDIPGYIIVDEKKLTSTFVRTPEFAEVPYATQMDPNLVIEYYSR